MRTKSSNKKPKASRQLVRNRIVALLSATASGKMQTRRHLEQVADQVLELFKDRVEAPTCKKGRVWTVGERSILHDLKGTE